MSKKKAIQKKINDTKCSDWKVEVPAKQFQPEKYLKNIEINKQYLQKANKQMAKSEKSIIKSIYKQILQVKQVDQFLIQYPTDITDLLAKQKVNQQQLKAKQLNMKREQLIKAIEKLDMRMRRESHSYKNISKQYNSPDQLKYKPNSILTKQQHQAMVQKIRQAQQIQDQRNQQRLYRLQKRLQEQEYKIKQMQQQKLNSQKQLRRKRSEYNINLRRQITELQNAQQVRANKQLKQLKKKHVLHQILEQKFVSKIIAPTLQQKKKKLKQIRQISRTFKIHEIDQHQRKYLKQRTKSMHLMQSKAKIGEQWIYQPPQKTQKLSKLLQDELAEKKKQLQKNKKAVQQKVLRQQNFIRHLKQSSRIKVDVQKQNEIMSRVESLKTQKRQPTQQQKQQIKNYLNQAKSMKKFTIQQSREMQKKTKEPQEKPRFQSQRANYLIPKQAEENSLAKRQQKIQKIIQSKENATQKAQKLQIQTKKIQDEFQKKQSLLQIRAGGSNTRKDATKLLLSGIQAKLELIKLSN